MLNYAIEERTAWRRWVTPKALHEKPIHRWFVFPHSFTSELVYALIDEWGLDTHDRVLDPFVGAGTTLLAAKEKGVPATGYDLLPLSVLVANTKVANYSLLRLEREWERLKAALDPDEWQEPVKTYPELVKKALPGRMLAAFDAIAGKIAQLSCSRTERNFFRLALLAVIPQFSHAVATGGWLKWVERKIEVESLPEAFGMRLEMMLGDLRQVRLPRRADPALNQYRAEWQARQADARYLPDNDETYSAVITSPPYPNRHDYTRVFGVELMFDFFNWEDTRRIRYQSIQSHPEAHPVRPETKDYRRPAALTGVVEELNKTAKDPRIPAMLDGYFLDIYICLREMRRVCKSGARIALVVGNAQYYGLPVSVDELTAELGEQSGLTCEKIVAVRYRGNSAQQMGKYGRKPSRESVVILRK
ncbi:MAG: hypothetical protein QHH75_05755 [Bacillota bacterium]|jgi:site-specific DNA-methyltransferase (cytosine-N4-specific)|nr:hypothetical protein [Bacillota bacterium]